MFFYGDEEQGSCLSLSVALAVLEILVGISPGLVNKALGVSFAG